MGARASNGSQLARLDALLDGVRTPNEIAAAMGVNPAYVRATVQRQGWQDRLPGRAAKADPGPSRAEDERLLGWIADRVAGLPVAAIARRDRVGASSVMIQTSAVRDADLAESGEPPLMVGRAYAWTRG